MAPPVLPVMPPTARSTASNQAPAAHWAVSQASPSAAAGFSDAISGALRTLAALEAGLDHPGARAAPGDPGSVADRNIASSQGRSATRMTAANRDRALAAFDDITRMQI